eukprot:FR739626.1.p1 GENE.FR739626.1~~FR739626.1.p1  ORF type:complete len:194 (+),score=27.19 FR739626.1:132-713(+)
MASGSRGEAESSALQKNVEDQLDRLLSQLEDCETMREELDDEEYEEMRADTMEQMKEFEKSLESMKAGNTLVDSINATQLAIQAAIKSACKTPEVIKMFAKREPDALRGRLAKLQQDLKLKKLPKEAFDDMAMEIITALKNMGETLSPAEMAIMTSCGGGVGQYTATSGEHVGEAAQAGLQAAAATDVSLSQK